MTLTNGLVVMTPTSVAKTGASSTATINADGSVTFGSCETLSLNGVFTSDYDNYMVSIRNNASTLATLRGRLRQSGSDNSTASSYTTQNILANGASVTGGRSADTFGLLFVGSATQRDGHIGYFFGPYLAQPTAIRSVTSYGEDSARIFDTAITHNQSVSYDGLTIYLGSGNMTGLLTVFGFNQ